MKLKEFDLELETDENLHPYYRYPDQAEAYLEYLKEQSFQRLPVKEEVRTLGNIGMTSLFLGKLNDAQYYLEKAVKLSDYNKNPDLIEFYIQQSIRLATVFQWKKNFQKSDDLFKQIISLINSDKKDSKFLDFAYQHYGKSLLDQKLYTKARKYFQQALDIRMSKGDQSLFDSSLEALHLIEDRKLL